MPSDMQTCDEHVPRGCDCNHRYVSVDAYHPPLKSPDEPYLEGVENVDWKWVDEEKTYWCSLDEKGREFPCCEWGYYENGLDDEDPYDSY
jgi:hypothetical protein